MLSQHAQTHNHGSSDCPAAADGGEGRGNDPGCSLMHVAVALFECGSYCEVPRFTQVFCSGTQQALVTRRVVEGEGA